MKAHGIALLLTALLAPAAASADVVILNNGDRLEGQVISETADEVSLRCHSGKIQYVQNIRRSTIARVEKSDVDAAGESIAAHPTTELSEPRTAAAAISDKPAFLKVTIAKWQAGKTAATGADLTRLINSSKPEELAQLSEIVKKEMNTTLAEFAAQAHWTAATELGEKRPLRLPMATRYEARALAPRIQEAYEQAIKQEVHGKPDPRAKARAKVTSKPAPAEGQSGTTQAAPPENPEAAPSAGSIAQLLESPNEFRANKADATAMRTQLEYAMSLLTERMRIDPEVTGDRNLRMSLTGQRTRLAALLKAAQAQVAAGIAAEKAAQAESKKQADEEKRKQRQATLDQQRQREEEFRNRQVEQALKQGAIPLQQQQMGGYQPNANNANNVPNNPPPQPPPPPQPQQK